MSPSLKDWASAQRWHNQCLMQKGGPECQYIPQFWLWYPSVKDYIKIEHDLSVCIWECKLTWWIVPVYRGACWWSVRMRGSCRALYRPALEPSPWRGSLTTFHSEVHKCVICMIFACKSELTFTYKHHVPVPVWLRTAQRHWHYARSSFKLNRSRQWSIVDPCNYSPYKDPYRPCNRSRGVCNRPRGACDRPGESATGPGESATGPRESATGPVESATGPGEDGGIIWWIGLCPNLVWSSWQFVIFIRPGRRLVSWRSRGYRRRRDTDPVVKRNQSHWMIACSLYQVMRERRITNRWVLSVSGHVAPSLPTSFRLRRSIT